MKNKTTAIILALLLGGAGIHKFYLGKYLLGILYIVFIWTYIPALLGLIDAIILICMPKEKFDAKYN